MNIGKLDRYITIEQATYSTSANTGDVYPSAWTTYKNVWAGRRQKQSTELAQSNQFVFLDSFIYTIRYVDATAITNKMRINDGGQYFYIVGIKELGRNEGWLVTAERRDNDG